MIAGVLLVEHILQNYIQAGDLSEVTLADHCLRQFLPAIQVTLALGQLEGQFGSVHVGHGAQPHPKRVTQQRQLSIVTLEATRVGHKGSGPLDGILDIGRYFGLERIIVVKQKVELALAKIDWLVETKARCLHAGDHLQD